jgi:RHS repeat-associated protein
VWINEKSTVYRTPYQFQGEYADEDHDLSDFGQRWFDGRRQFFYSTDQAPMDDPNRLFSEPGLQATYTYANANPLAFVDPDGRSPVGITTGTERKQLRQDLRAAGVDLPDLRAKIRSYFGTHTGLGGQIAFTVLSNYSRLKKIQEFADRWDMKPIVQFEVDIQDGKVSLTNVKFGLGQQRGKQRRQPRRQVGTEVTDGRRPRREGVKEERARSRLRHESSSVG